MWFDNDLFRISYLPTIIIPILFVLFTNDLKLVQIIPDIIGWSFLLISENLINDYVDMDRKLPLGKRGLLTLSILFLLFGIYVLRNVLPYVIAFVVLGILYHVKLKHIIFVDILSMLLIFGLPYFSLAKNIDINILIFLTLSIGGSDFIHRIVDEKKYKKIAKQINLLTFILYLLSIFFTVYLVWSNNFYQFLAPFILLFLAVLYFVLKDYLLKSSPSLKIVGVYIGCMLMFYVIAVLAQMDKII